MIPTFPAFKSLSEDDRLNFEAYTSTFPPYSEYNFTGLWCWNTRDNVALASIGENLVLRFQDYFNPGLFFSFIGRHDVPGTIESLLVMAEELGRAPALRFVPGSVDVTDTLSNQYQFDWDRDNFDYVYSVQDLAGLKGNQYQTKRRLVRRFMERYDFTVSQLDLQSSEIQSEVKELLIIWGSQNGVIQHESEALGRLLGLVDAPNVRAIGVYVENRLAGFLIVELLQRKWAVAYFEKADREIVGLHQYMKQRLAIQLMAWGCEYVNFEEDLGLEGLRRAKLSYHPSFFLKKYVITRRA